MKKLIIKKNNILINPNDEKRIYHDIEGSYDGYYFFAKTDNSHKLGFVSYGIDKGAVYKLDVWKGGHPVGRWSVKGENIHVANDFIAGYFNKWDVRPRTIINKTIVKKIVLELEKIANRKKKSTPTKTRKIIKKK